MTLKQQRRSSDRIDKGKRGLKLIARLLYKSITNQWEEYNKSVGWLDLAYRLIFLYRATIKTKRWYLKILRHCVDIAKVNALFIYGRHCDQRNVPKKPQLSLLKFTVLIAFALANAQTVQITRPVRRPSRSSIEGETRK